MSAKPVVKQTDNLPKSLCHPPGFLGDLVRHMDETAEYPMPEYSLAGSLCLLSTITGRKIQDYRGTRPNLFTISIGPSGCGKDHAREINTRILQNTQLEGPDKFTSESAIVTALESSPSLLCQIDEIGIYLKAACSERAPAHLAGVVAAMMTSFTSANRVWKPTGFANLKNTRSVDQPNLVVHGTSTVKKFFDALSDSDVASGFVGRILVFCSPSLNYAMPQAFDLRSIPKSITDFVEQWLERSSGPGNISDRSPDPKVLPIDAAAKHRLADHFSNIAGQRLGEDPISAAIWSRTSEKTSKLALLHTISRSSDLIELQDADWSIAVANFLTRRMISLIKGNVASSDFERKVQRILQVVKDEGGVITQRDFSRRTQWLPARERNEIVTQLKDAGSLFDGSKNTKGREAHALGLSIADLEKQGWTLITEEMMKEAITKKKAEARKLQMELNKC